MLSTQVLAAPSLCFNVYTAERVEEAGLHYTDLSEDGILRRGRHGKHYYIYEDGTPVTNPSVLARIAALQIPPGFKRVWISTDKLDHIQAIAYDESGKLQYKYHPEWKIMSEKRKYARIQEFGKALPTMRAKVAQDLKLPDFEKDKVLAIAFRIFEITQIRIGGKKGNRHYGLTTLTKAKAFVDGNTLNFDFHGKSNKKNENTYELSPHFAAILKTMEDSPGVRWLRYKDENGRWHDLKPSDINDYIKRISGGKFSAKDFRTWHGTVYAAEYLDSVGRPLDEDPHEYIDEAVAYVADRLVNTDNVSRESYIFPGLFTAFNDWVPFKIAFDVARRRIAQNNSGRSVSEEAVLILLMDAHRE